MSSLLRSRRGQGLLPILGICVAMSLSGLSAIYLASQEERQAQRMAMVQEGQQYGSGAIDFLASLLGSQAIRGFTIPGPPYNPVPGTYWTIYPVTATSSANQFQFQSGRLPDAAHASYTYGTLPRLSQLNDFCNPQSMRADFFGNMMTTMPMPPQCSAPGIPANCCYKAPMNVVFRSAESGDYLEVLAAINGGLLPESTIRKWNGDGFGMRARIRIPALSPLDPPTCSLTPQYAKIWWHQYVGDNVNMRTFPNPNLSAADTAPTAARLVFPTGPLGPAPDFRPGTIDGRDTSVAPGNNPITLSVSATNSPSGQTVVANPPPTVVGNGLPNATRDYRIDGEVDGPGGTGTCSTPITTQQLDTPTCRTSVPGAPIVGGIPQIYWRDCWDLQISSTMPAQLPGEAPRPDAWLNTATATAPSGTGATIGGGLVKTNNFGKPLATHPTANTTLMPLCTFLTTNQTTLLTFDAFTTGDAGQGPKCPITVRVIQVPPPTCNLTVTLEQPPGYPTPVLHARLVGNPPGVTTRIGTNFTPTSWSLSGPGVARNGSGSGTDQYFAVPSTGTLTYTAYVYGPSGQSAACTGSVVNTPPSCTMTASSYSIYTGQCVTVYLNPIPRNGPPNLSVVGAYIYSPVASGNLAPNGGGAVFCPPGPGNYWMGGTIWGPGQPPAAATNCPSPTPIRVVKPVINCNLTANPPVVSPDIGTTDGGIPGRTFSITGQGQSTTLCMTCSSFPPGAIRNAQINGRDVTWPLRWTGSACIPSGYGPYGAANYTYWGGAWGIGGSGDTAAAGVAVSCALHVSYLEGIWPKPYQTFSWDDTTFYTDNNPPFCTWTWPGHGSRGSDPGCFAPETKLKTASGDWRRADEIEPGTWLWNPVTAAPVMVKKVIVGPEKYPLVELGYGTKRLRVTTKHPMPTPDGVRSAESLTAADSILGDDGAYHRLEIVRRIPSDAPPTVYNFDLEVAEARPEAHMLLAEGIVTGDYFLQVRLEKKERSLLSATGNQK